MQVGISEIFYRHFYTTENLLVVKSPGRVNIIGEHTDYNDGFVLPAAIDKAASIAIAARTDNEIHLFAADLDESFSITTTRIEPIASPQWPNYLLGVVAQFQKAGFAIPGFNAVLSSNVPVGAGLSSSAAIECALVFALNELLKANLSKMEMVKMAQKSEHEFAGVMCGIMDQFASMFGKKDHAIKLDCRSLQHEYIPFNMKGFKIVLLDTGVKHSLASTAYNTRRMECEQGVQWVREKYPEVISLRDINMDMLNECVAAKDKIVYKRCRYVIEENLRLAGACENLKRNDIQSLGYKMYQTHAGLSQEFEVSCPELDFLVHSVKNESAVLGARMMGGGFGGCTINLVREECVPDIIARASTTYYQKFQVSLTPHIVSLEDGTQIHKTHYYV